MEKKQIPENMIKVYTIQETELCFPKAYHCGNRSRIKEQCSPYNDHTLCSVHDDMFQHLFLLMSKNKNKIGKLNQEPKTRKIRKQKIRITRKKK